MVAMEIRPGFAFRPEGCYLATGQRPSLSHLFQNKSVALVFEGVTNQFAVYN